MKISLQNWERACVLLKETAVADLHLDLPGELLMRSRMGEKDVIRRRYLPSWRRSGVCLIGAAVYVEDHYLPEAGLRNVLLQIEALKEELSGLSGEAHLVRGREDLMRAREKGSVGIFLYLEGLDALGEDAALLPLLRELGVTGASLTWSRRNLLACGCCRASQNRRNDGGITEAGIRMIGEMHRLGMFLDVSHLNDEGMEYILTETELPVLATHSNARNVHFHYRNLTDAQIDLLAQRGGVIGLNACSRLAGSYGNGRHLEWLARQADYLIRQAGDCHAALGLDLCHGYDLAGRKQDAEEGQGEDCLAGHDELVLLAAALLENGTEPETVSRLFGVNAFAFLQKVFS